MDKKEFLELRKQIKRDSCIKKVKEQVKASIITLIENTDGYFETQSDFEEAIIQKIKDLI